MIIMAVKENDPPLRDLTEQCPCPSLDGESQARTGYATKRKSVDRLPGYCALPVIYTRRGAHHRHHGTETLATDRPGALSLPPVVPRQLQLPALRNECGMGVSLRCKVVTW